MEERCAAVVEEGHAVQFKPTGNALCAQNTFENTNYTENRGGCHAFGTGDGSMVSSDVTAGMDWVLNRGWDAAFHLIMGRQLGP